MSKHILEAILDELPYPVQQEQLFYPKRRFRLDYLIELPNDKKIAIEYEGGVFSRGRHNRAGGFISDCTKYNYLAVLGIPLLRYTVKHTQEPSLIYDEINAVINRLNQYLL
jgi:hypothetical protein|tara:strand:- start:7081 stop:7413 length:333 start_codon:yes stop_codon:yes gene_type:complete